MNWAWEQKLPPSPKLVLMALADAADDAGECWPRLKTVAAKCCTSERTVQRVLKEFEAAGLLAVTRRFTADGRQTSNGYRLSLAPYPDKLSPSPSSCRGEGDSGVTGRVTQLCHPGGDAAMSPLEPPLNTPREPSQQPPGVSPSPTLAFPERLARTDEAAIALLLKDVEGGLAQALLDELAGAMETPNTIKTTPVRWFRALVERTRQGRFVPTAGVHIAERRSADERRRTEREKARLEHAQRAPPTPEEREVIRQRLSALKASLTKPKQPAGTTPPFERRR